MEELFISQTLFFLGVERKINIFIYVKNPTNMDFYERRIHMWYWWFMLICDLLVPVTMLIAGRMMWKHCPKSINGIIGYRTTRSMKNMDTWKFAHDYCGRLWWKLGVIMLIPSALIHIPFYQSNEKTIGIIGGILVTIQCIVLIVSIFPTESALKRTFNDDGTRR